MTDQTRDRGEPAELLRASFDPAVKPYFMTTIVLICVLTVVGIPFLIIAIPLGFFFIRRYFERLDVVLTERTLEVRRGLISRIESTIPLDKITDLQMFEGPLMRAFGLRGFKVETAGSSTPTGSLVTVIGIVDAPAFRRSVLRQRDALDDRRSTPREAAAARSDPEADPVLVEIRDILRRIESRWPTSAARSP